MQGGLHNPPSKFLKCFQVLRQQVRGVGGLNQNPDNADTFGGVGGLGLKC